MKSRSEICSLVLEKTGIAIHLQDDVEHFKSSKVKIQKNDTFKKWKKRVFEDSDIDLKVYLPCDVAPNKQMKNIQSECEDFIKGIFRDQKRDAAASENKKLWKSIDHYPISALQDEVDKGELDPAVVGFLKRIIDSPANSMPVDYLICKLVLAYNSAVIKHRGLLSKMS